MNNNTNNKDSLDRMLNAAAKSSDVMTLWYEVEPGRSSHLPFFLCLPGYGD